MLQIDLEAGHWQPLEARAPGALGETGDRVKGAARPGLDAHHARDDRTDQGEGDLRILTPLGLGMPQFQQHPVGLLRVAVAIEHLRVV